MASAPTAQNSKKSRHCPVWTNRYMNSIDSKNKKRIGISSPMTWELPMNPTVKASNREASLPAYLSFHFRSELIGEIHTSDTQHEAHETTQED